MSFGYDPEAIYQDADIEMMELAEAASEIQLRYAVVRGKPGFGAADLRSAIEPYLPANYRVVGPLDDGGVMIEGVDDAGWTLDDYVIPRLASGLYFAEEI